MKLDLFTGITNVTWQKMTQTGRISHTLSGVTRGRIKVTPEQLASHYVRALAIQSMSTKTRCT